MCELGTSSTTSAPDSVNKSALANGSVASSKMILEQGCSIDTNERHTADVGVRRDLAAQPGLMT
jgi:hypothetical protein